MPLLLLLLLRERVGDVNIIMMLTYYHNIIFVMR